MLVVYLSLTVIEIRDSHRRNLVGLVLSTYNFVIDTASQTYYDRHPSSLSTIKNIHNNNKKTKHQTHIKTTAVPKHLYHSEAVCVDSNLLLIT